MQKCSRHSIFIFYLFILFQISIFAQDDRIDFVPIKTNQGISDSYFNWIIQDSKGFMWFGSIYNGLYRYDGYNFKVYKPEPRNPKSLSNIGIEVIYEAPADSGKVLWIGTRSGLNKFDREKEEFTSYFNSADPQSLSSNYVLTMCGDNEGNLWIGTHDGGLNKFDRNSNRFIRYTHNPEDTNSLGDDRILILYMDRSGYIWIGTDGGGLDRFDPENELFTHFRHDPHDPHSLSNDHIWSICEDNSGIIWIGASNGLNKLVQRSSEDEPEKFIRFLHDPNDPNSIGGNFIKSLYLDRFDVLWIGLYGEGVATYNLLNGNFQHFKQGIGDRVKCIQEDQAGDVLWFATDGGGLVKWYRQKQKIIHYKHDSTNPNSLSNNYVYSMCEDKNGFIWIATDAAGIDCLDPIKNSFINRRHNPLDPNSLANDIVYSVFNDKSGVLWFGTASGLSRYNYIQGNFKNYLSKPENKNNLKHGWLVSIIEDPRPNENSLWMGSWSGGLYKFNKTEEFFSHYSADSQDTLRLSSNAVRYIYGEHDRSRSILWIGTEGGGVNKFDLISNKIVTYKHDTSNPNSLSSDMVWVIYRDKAGTLWIGTVSGLNRYDDATDSFVYYSKINGLADDCVYGILEDNEGNLWLSTLNGISRFDPLTNSFQNFTKQDGLQNNEFSMFSFMHRSNGEMYFGGNNGINSFYPDSLKSNAHIPSIVLTDFKLFHESIKPAKNSLLSKTISETDEIILSYNENVISLEFSALDYSIPEKNQYAYRMDGVDQNWVYTNASRRFATYTQLNPGTYTFRVKGSNNDGIWNDQGASIRITVMPPWWRTTLAYFLYVLAGITFLAFIWQFQLKRLRDKHNQEIEHLEMEKLKEVDRLKSNFFTNISHEFRTPLTLIEGPLKQIQKGNFHGNLKEQCQLMLNNTKRLLDLVNQLLDLSKLESGKAKLQAQKISLIPLLRGLVKSFASLADQRGINLDFKALQEKIDVYLDVEKFEKIINNLLANAFKFTPENGKIIVDVSIVHPLLSPFSEEETDPSPLSRGDLGGCKNNNSQFPIPSSYFVEITISNTGSSIPPDKIDKIFDRFYQVDESNNHHYQGTGIGLALTKELVELHHGQIIVRTDNPGQFLAEDLTIFTIYLPVGCNHLNHEEIVDKPITAKVEKDDLPFVFNDKVIVQERSVARSSNEKILIVEDHADVRNYIRSILDNGYYIFEAEDGQKGLNLAVDKQPDLIISDVMMPNMDGFEFCRLIKENQQTSHIPVILLTARAGQEDRLEGLETGADDYLTKPFDDQELIVRSNNLIEQRRKLRERFLQDPLIKPKEITVTSSDEKFLSNLSELVDSELSNSKLTVSFLIDRLAISHTGLHRKVKALTGVSPVEFIKLRRLNRARALLENRFGNVSEIAFEVGFNSLSFFSASFKKQFGITPSLFLKQDQS